ncbi:hypothetical protein QCD69_22250, partial [Erwinia sp. PsM31]|nr:hypothetical protein [Erwinia sp. PsM31]
LPAVVAVAVLLRGQRQVARRKGRALWQKADLLPDSDQQALIAVLDSFVKKSMVEQVIGFNNRR